MKESIEKRSSKAESGSEEISLEDLDKILEEDSPEFLSEMATIGSDEELKNADVEPLGVDQNEALLKEEEEETAEGELTLKGRIKHWLKVRRQVLKKWLSERAVRARNQFYTWLWALVHFLRNDLPDFTKYLLSVIKTALKAISQKVKSLSELSWREKLGALLVAAIFGLSIYIVRMNLSGGWFPDFDQNMVTNFNDVADKVYQLHDKEDLIGFYRAFPQPEHIVLLNKFVVNFRRLGSGDNPMGYFEFYVNADSQDTAIEIKDREKELIDRIARAMEALSYQEASGVEGKKRMKMLVRQEINQALNQGLIEDVFFKMYVTKP